MIIRSILPAALILAAIPAAKAQQAISHTQYASCAAVAAMLAHSFSQPGADQNPKLAQTYKSETATLQRQTIEKARAVVGKDKASEEGNRLIMRMAVYFIGNTAERFGPEAGHCQRIKLISPMQ